MIFFPSFPALSCVCVCVCEHISSEDSKASELWGWKLFIVIDDSGKNSELKVNGPGSDVTHERRLSKQE